MSLSVRDRIAAAALCAGVVAAGAAGWLVLAPSAGGGVAADPLASAFAGSDVALPSASAAPSTGSLVIDVQGGVAQPGIVTLPAGARVADALDAAGGYADDADLAAAASALNLAAVLSDGQQVYVPVIGVAAEPGGGGAPGSADGGLVNLNTASPEALDALPGIGPVTVQKIVAARDERPFATLDELIERDVMNRGQLDDIRDLVTL
jgi:competence protein ComEA